MPPTADLVHEKLSCHVLNEPCAADVLECERNGCLSCIAALRHLNAGHPDDLSVYRVRRAMGLTRFFLGPSMYPARILDTVGW